MGQFASVGTTYRPDERTHREIEITHAAIVERTAAIGSTPFAVICGGFTDGSHALDRRTALHSAYSTGASSSPSAPRPRRPIHRARVSSCPAQRAYVGARRKLGRPRAEYDGGPCAPPARRHARRPARRPARAVLGRPDGDEPVGRRIDIDPRGTATFAISRTRAGDETIDLGTTPWCMPVSAGSPGGADRRARNHPEVARAMSDQPLPNFERYPPELALQDVMGFDPDDTDGELIEPAERPPLEHLPPWRPPPPPLQRARIRPHAVLLIGPSSPTRAAAEAHIAVRVG